MSDKPQQTPSEEQNDILEQIIAQGLNKMDAPAQGEPSPQDVPSQEPSPTPEGKQEGNPPTEKKNKRSSVYIYLLILFGAAFMMLLLAYFVQQRNSETTIRDLRNSMNLSREDLMAEINTLKEEKEKQESTIQAMEDAQKEAEARQKELEEENTYYSWMTESSSLDREKGQMLAWLERFVREKDYLMAAVGIESYNQWYDWNWITPPVGGQPPLPGQQARYRELRQEVLDRSNYLIAEPNPRATEDNPMLWITLAEDKFGPGEQRAATRLWNILWYSTNQLDQTARDVVSFYDDEELMAALEDGAFRPSTLSLLEQLRDDLIRRGLLNEDGDGKLTMEVLYGDTGYEPLD